MENKKLIVVWLCYFNNQFLEDQIRPWKRVGEFAPWISNMIPLFENDNDVELHVVSQYRWIRGYRSFKIKSVTYHFFNAGIPLIGRHWPGFFRFDVLSDFFVTKTHFAKIIRNIKPDILHLHGAENEFCTGILQFQKKYPVFITIQGFIHKSNSQSKSVKRRASKELEILRKFNHFGYRTKTMSRDIRSINPKSILHWHSYPMSDIEPMNIEKKYDLVFFANITKDKGIEDLLYSIQLIKKRKPDISLCIIGGGDSVQFKKLSNNLGLHENVYWAGFLKSQEEVHKLASSAKVSVLPTYHDIISGTIIESLFLKLPVVAYNVGSIHEVNKDSEIISLVDKGDINGLANKIIELINNEGLREERSALGILRAIEMFRYTNDEVRSDLINAYRSVIDDFLNKGKE